MIPREQKQHLPCYSNSQWYTRLRQSWRFISLCASLAALAVGWYLPMTQFETPLETSLDFFRSIGKDSYWESHREEVKRAFVTSWDAYTKYAWG